MKKVLFRGPLLTRSGYGEQARFALRSLLTRTEIFDLYVEPTNWGKTNWIHEKTPETDLIKMLIDKRTRYGGNFDASIQVTIPNEFEKLAPINIGYTAGIETTKIAPQWIEKSRIMDRIIVVSNHSKSVYDKTSYHIKNNQGQVVKFENSTPVHAVQYAVRDIEAKEIDLENIKTEFNFLAVAQQGPRKNLHQTVKCFLEEFQDEENVGLILKTFSKNNSIQDRSETKQAIRNWIETNFPEKKCSVYILHGNLTEQEMQGLYQHEKVKAFVTTTHGEGFGLPIFEAAINKLPIAAPAWSGQNDFLYMPVLNEVSGKKKITPLFTKIAFELKPIPETAVWEGVLQKDSEWCYPKDKSVKKAFRAIYDGYKYHYKNAVLLSDMIKEKFSEEKMYDMFCNAVLGSNKTEERVHLL
jgi:hypothetical protein